jgi:two-component system chemotaxis response regulator CheB
MTAIREGSFLRFRCHTGHAYTAAALAECGLPSIERTLWSALAQLEEREVLLKELQQSVQGEPGSRAAAEYEHAANETRRVALKVRELALDPALALKDTVE